MIPNNWYTSKRGTPTEMRRMPTQVFVGETGSFLKAYYGHVKAMKTIKIENMLHKLCTTVRYTRPNNRTTAC